MNQNKTSISLTDFYSKLTEKKFKLVTIFICLIGDLYLVSYLYFKFSNFALFEKIFRYALSMNNIGPEQVPQDFLYAQFQILINALITMLVAVIFIHLIVYLYYYLGRKAARSYVIFLSWAGTIFYFLMTLSLFSSKISWSLGFLLIAFGYIVVIKGHKYFKFEEEE